MIRPHDIDAMLRREDETFDHGDAQQRALLAVDMREMLVRLREQIADVEALVVDGIKWRRYIQTMRDAHGDVMAHASVALHGTHDAIDNVAQPSLFDRVQCEELLDQIRGGEVIAGPQT